MKTMVLDVGGTAIKSAVYDPDLQENSGLTDIAETPTEAFLGGEHVVKKILSVVRENGARHGFGRIGISTAGEVDPSSGTVIHANHNIPGYTGTPLAQIVSETFGLPVKVENDVNAAAIGEACFGAGRGIPDFVCLTYGTGVGGAIYLGGYEKYASATALVNKARNMDPSLDSGRKIFERMGEPAVKALVDEWIEEIVYGLVTIVHVMNPACVILGGGIMEQSYVTENVKTRLMQNIMPAFRGVQVRKAALGNRAGLLGAASLFQEEE